MYKILFLFVIFISGCAIETMPTGGDKDITPPQIVSTSPQNLTRNFKENEVTLEFDEYIVVKDFNQQFAVSPPLDDKVSYELKGKKLTITTNGVYKENTTYTFSFGNSLQDNTEGNVQSEFKYIFSTGDFIDSSFVVGRAINAFTGLPVENVLAALYPLSEEDSLPYKEKPLYYAVTDQGGRFNISHIKLQDYQLILFEDQNFDFNINSRSEMKGFVDNNIDPSIDSVYNVSVFKEEKFFTVYGVEYKGYGKAEVYLSTALDHYGQISSPNYSGNFHIIPDESKDTLTMWFNPEGIDTLDLHFLHPFSNRVDTINLDLTSKDYTKLAFSSKSEILTPQLKPIITSNYPLEKVNYDSILFVSSKDTVKPPPFAIDSTTFEVQADLNVAFGDKYNYYFYPGAWTDIFGNKNSDTSSVSFSTKLEKDYAFLILEINYTNQKQGIIQLLDKDKNVVVTEIVKKSNQYEIPYLEPGEYSLRVIIDKNSNGKWDSGDFYNKVQPEKVVYYNQAIELRANWEIEVIFNVDANQY